MFGRIAHFVTKGMPLPVVIGSGLTGLSISRSLSCASIDHVLIGRRPDSSPRLGESMNLEGTLLLHLEAPERIPVLRTLAQGTQAVRERAEHLAAATGGEVEETVGRVGGGALPLAELPSFACAIEESLGAPLRAGDPPVVGVVRDGRLLLDCLTLTDAEADEAASLVAAARG